MKIKRINEPNKYSSSKNNSNSNTNQSNGLYKNIINTCQVQK